MTRPSHEKMTIDHVAWLEAENRHTQASDNWTESVLRRGWAERCQGIMGPGWFRVRLTAAGRLAWKEEVADA